MDGGFEPSEPLAQAFSEMRDLGLSAVSIDTAHGGSGLPLTMTMLMFEQLSRACLGTSTYLAFTSAFADMLERFASKEISGEFVPHIASGALSGSMCLTEPGAGSDLGALRTAARKEKDGTYRLTGTKRFITNGGGGLGLVLARLEGAPAGLMGLSLFFVELWPGGKGVGKPNYVISKLEDKMGMRASATCEVIYDDTVARLVGVEGEGFKMMLHLMNEARIAVGIQGLGAMEAAIAYARNYAAHRVQFGKPILELPLFARGMADMETERDAFRAFIVDTVSTFDIYQRLDLKKRRSGDLSEEETHLYKRTVKGGRHRTPLTKYYGTEAGARIALKCVQCLGGYGYMKEFEAERILRDAVGGLLYEGTSQVQSLMAMKDLMKEMTKHPGRFMRDLLTDHPLRGALTDSECRKALKNAHYEFRKNVALLVWRCSRNVERLMRHAEGICEAQAYLEVLVVLQKHADRDPGREGLFRRYKALVVPRLAAVYESWRQ